MTAAEFDPGPGKVRRFRHQTGACANRPFQNPPGHCLLERGGSRTVTVPISTRGSCRAAARNMELVSPTLSLALAADVTRTASGWRTSSERRRAIFGAPRLDFVIWANAGNSATPRKDT